MRKQQVAKSESEFAGGFEERTSSFSFTAFLSVESIWKYIHARSNTFASFALFYRVILLTPRPR